MNKVVQFAASLLILSMFGAQGAAADQNNSTQTFVLFGPESFNASQSKAKPTTETRTFNVQGTFSNTRLEVVNGAGMEGFLDVCSLNGGLGKVVKCLLQNVKAALQPRKRANAIEISLNGENVLSKNLSQFDLSFSKTVTVAANNRIEVRVSGNKNAFVTLRIRGEKLNHPPVPAIQVSQASTVAPSRVLFDASQSSDPDGDPLTYSWTFGDNATAAGAVVTHEFTDVRSYLVILTLKDSAGLSVTKSINVQTQAAPVAPDPVTSAPPLNPATSNSIADQIRFLYEGPNPVQVGVLPGAIDESRLGRVHGKVLGENGQPLSGVRVDLLGKSELGHTFTRQDGQYDIVANGGEILTLKFERSGYFSAQRQAELTGNIAVTIEDLIMIRPDEKVTTVSMGSTQAQVAQSSQVQDSRGSRTATLLFPPNTTANIVMPDGSTKAMATLNVRATEFTVGADGPNRMPASLPPQSAYTYAIELSADEAIAMGADSVQFSKPIQFYVDNFLDVPAGIIVPLGVYNAKAGNWEPELDGLVIKILAEQNGLAVIDVRGANEPATTADLNLLGIDSTELSRLAQLYDPGKTLWRFRISHFSTLDGNFGVASDDTAKDGQPPKTPEPPGDDCHRIPGCEIDYTRRTLTEKISLPGMPFSLSYSTDRQLGYMGGNTYELPLTKSSIDFLLLRLEVETTVAGRTFKETLPNTPNLVYKFQLWDGKDSFGRQLTSPTKARVTVRYFSYTLYRYCTAVANFGSRSFGRSFSSCSSVRVSDPSRVEEVPFEIVLGPTIAASNQGIGGWNLNIHHSYDRTSSNVFMGDGTLYSGRDIPSHVTAIAGTGVSGSQGDGGLATQATLLGPRGLTIGSDQSVYFVDGCCTIRKIDPNGIITRYAGTGVAGFSGDGGQALQAKFSGIGRLSFHRSGALIFSESQNHVIRSIDKFGIVRTLAGKGQTPGNSGDDGPAIQALLRSPAGAIVTRDGSIYFADSGNNVLRRIGPTGTITRIAGTGTAGYSGDGGPALEAQFNSPAFCTEALDGSIYVADRDNHIIRKIQANGIISTIAGIPGSPGFSGDGGPATEAQLDSPQDMTIDRSGNLYLIDQANNRIRKVSASGIINSAIGGGSTTVSSHPLTGSAVRLKNPINIIWNPVDDSILFTEQNGFMVRKFENAWNFRPGISSIASRDGSQIFQFDEKGRHVSTSSALTHEPLFSFEYDQLSRLNSVRDSYGATWTINRDSQGAPSQLVDPDGHIVRLETGNDSLTAVVGPEGERTEIQYTSGNLISQFKSPSGATTHYTYDLLGLLKKDLNPAGGFLEFSQVGDFTQFTNSLGHMSKFRSYANEKFDGTNFESTDAAGRITLRTQLDAFPKSFAEYPEGHRTQTLTAFDPLTGTSKFETSTQFDGVPGPQAQTIQETRSIEALGSDNFIYNILRTGTTRQESTTYNSQTRTFTNQTALGQTSLLQIDQHEKPVSVRLGSFTPIQFSYDNRGRINRSIQGDRETTFSYNSSGDLESITNALGLTTILGHDGSRRLTSLKLPDSRTIATAYTPDARVSSVTTPSQFIHSMIYNAFDFLSGYQGPAEAGSTGAITYAYNLERQPTSENYSDGRSKTYSYDSFGRVTAAGDQTSFVGYGYDDKGRMSLVTSSDTVVIEKSFIANVATKRTYSGRVTGVISYPHLDRNRPSAQVFNSQSVAFGYDADERLQSAGGLTINRDQASGMINGLNLGVVSRQVVFNEFGEISDSTYQVSNSPIFSQKFTQDKLGRIAKKVETIQGVSTTFDYSYDLTGRLTGVNRNGVNISTYAYDNNSNRIGATINGLTFAGTYDSQDKIVSYGPYSYVFSPHGDLQSKHDATTNKTSQYSYDIFGQLKRAEVTPALIVEYLTDGDHNRVQLKVNGSIIFNYIYNEAGQLVGSINASGSQTQYVYASQAHSPDFMIRGANQFLFIKDHLGSIRAVVNASTGATVQNLEYDEFGRVLTDSNPGFQPFGFAGGLYDFRTGLVRFGARDYDAETGRWTSKDPILFNGLDTNLYGYVMQDPINFNDPSGLVFEGWIGDRTTPGQQAGIGAGLLAGGIAAIRSGVLTLNPWLAIGGGLAAYEGIQNIRHARERGFEVPIPGIQDIMDFSSNERPGNNVCKAGM